jgi:hypothetical protein
MSADSRTGPDAVGACTGDERRPNFRSRAGSKGRAELIAGKIYAGLRERQPLIED